MSDWGLEYFKPHEFRCRCPDCEGDGDEANLTGLNMSLEFVGTLDTLRDRLGFPLVVTSGWRCHRHWAERDKLVPGAHQLGIATDFALYGQKVFLLMGEVLRNFPTITGMGLNQKGDVDKRFAHLDSAPTIPGVRMRPWVWTY